VLIISAGASRRATTFAFAAPATFTLTVFVACLPDPKNRYDDSHHNWNPNKSWKCLEKIKPTSTAATARGVLMSAHSPGWGEQHMTAQKDQKQGFLAKTK
jgi:hypothetical protein